ncbi:hypothetical protein [Parasediminibacterium sp. JCM 36343]
MKILRTIIKFFVKLVLILKRRFVQSIDQTEEFFLGAESYKQVY